MFGVLLERAVKFLEGVRACKIHPARDECAARTLVRDGMSLQPVLHLQAVLKLTQKNVGVRKPRALALRNQLAVGQPAQTDERVRSAQPRVAPAEGELQGLGDELDLADPAAAEL